MSCSVLPAGSGPALELSSLDGDNGFAINGIAAEYFSGGSVSGAGDFNGDGIDDIVTGAWRTNPNEYGFGGAIYVIFGRSGGYRGASFELSSLDGSSGFEISSAADGILAPAAWP